MSKCRIIIADDHRVLIEGIKSVLKGGDQYLVVAEAVNGMEAVELAAKHRPDIIIMDISMPGIDGIEATRRLKEIAPETKVLIYTMHSDKTFISELYKVGISGYVLKGGAISDLLSALNSVWKGKDYFTSTAPHNLLPGVEPQTPSGASPQGLECLSSREQEVFELLADGHPIKVIAEKLFISPKTVETHKYKIMTKLNAKSVPELTKLAIKYDLIKV